MSKEERRAYVAKRDIEKVRARDRERAKTPKRKAHVKKTVKTWRQANPLRMAAHNAVARAVRKGDLVKGPCERAGEGGCNGVIHAHHEDYEKPLDVRWLCARHHHEERRAESS